MYIVCVIERFFLSVTKFDNIIEMVLVATHAYYCLSLATIFEYVSATKMQSMYQMCKHRFYLFFSSNVKYQLSLTALKLSKSISNRMCGLVFTMHLIIHKAASVKVSFVKR